MKSIVDVETLAAAEKDGTASMDSIRAERDALIKEKATFDAKLSKVTAERD